SEQKPATRDSMPKRVTSKSTTITPSTKTALPTTALPSRRRATDAPSVSRTWMYTGVNAAESEPANTFTRRDGTRKAIRNASTASPVPNRYATASSFSAAVALTTTEKPATVNAAPNMRRFTEAVNQSASRRLWADCAVIGHALVSGPGTSLSFKPRLKHQNVPQQVVPVTRTTLVFRPLLRDGFWIEKTLAF